MLHAGHSLEIISHCQQASQGGTSYNDENQQNTTTDNKAGAISHCAVEEAGAKITSKHPTGSGGENHLPLLNVLCM